MAPLPPRAVGAGDAAPQLPLMFAIPHPAALAS